MNIKKEFLEILDGLENLIQKNQFPIIEFQNDKKIDSYNLDLLLKTKQTPQKTPIFENKHREANLTCKLCPKKISGIRNFIHKGTLPILVLHYSSEFQKNKKFTAKTNSDTIFREKKFDEVFERMFQKSFGTSMKELYYQEFPACNFSNQMSNETDWTERQKNCTRYVEDTIERYNIQMLLFIGASAVMYFGKEEANHRTNQIQNVQIGKINIKSMVLRSPEGILSLEDKRKKINKEKEKDLFEKAKQEEDTVKLGILESLARIKIEVGLP
jgi:hypothetical protein